MTTLKKILGVPGPGNNFHVHHVSSLNNSFKQCLGYSLIEQVKDPNELARQLYFAPFVLISHGIEKDPIFNYANQTALNLFAMNWSEFIQMPSKYSAEQPNREERARLLAEVEQNGFIDNYSGVRIAKNGQRFLIDKAIVWNVLDRQGNLCGQAAYFKEWKAL